MVYFLLSALILGLDQATKETVRRELSVESRRPLGKHWELWRRGNPGVAYGGLSENPKLVLTGTCVLTGLLGFWLASSNGWRERLGLSVMLGGALGNLTDRLRFGTVTDFLHYKSKRSPVFNLADVHVALGSLLILLSSVFKA